MREGGFPAFVHHTMQEAALLVFKRKDPPLKVREKGETAWTDSPRSPLLSRGRMDQAPLPHPSEAAEKHGDSEGKNFSGVWRSRNKVAGAGEGNGPGPPHPLLPSGAPIRGETPHHQAEGRKSCPALTSRRTTATSNKSASSRGTRAPAGMAAPSTDRSTPAQPGRKRGQPRPQPAPFPPVGATSPCVCRHLTLVRWPGRSTRTAQRCPRFGGSPCNTRGGLRGFQLALWLAVSTFSPESPAELVAEVTAFIRLPKRIFFC